MNNIVDVAESAVQSPVAELLVAIDSFINEDVLVDDAVGGVFEDKLVEDVEGIDPGESVESSNAVVQDDEKPAHTRACRFLPVFEPATYC